MKKVVIPTIGALCICIFFLFSCLKINNTNSTPISIKGSNANVDALLQMKTSSSFNFATTNLISLNITILAPNNTPIKNALITILTKSTDLGGIVLYKSMTDQYGKVSGLMSLPSSITTVVIEPSYPGVMRKVAVSIINNIILCTLGGQNGYIGNIILNSPLSSKVMVNANNAFKIAAAPYSYMGKFNLDGTPDYFNSINEPISSSFLANIAESLPSGIDVGLSHPNYLSSSAESNIHLTQNASVSFTFVGQGAQFHNSVAYFTYPTNNPPKIPSDINSLHIILPNASFSGDGGGLSPGNTVSLGSFIAGTSIGFALIADGWDSQNHKVGDGLWIVYSLKDLNPELDINLKKHNVLLYDNSQNLFLFGFEDLKRDAGSDNDFNDVLFYVKTNPISTISISNMSVIDIAPTNQPNYTNKFSGTIAFEDNWPYLGDYDLNDLVVGYNYIIDYNSRNDIIAMKAQYILKASGAAFRNGFGVQFPFLSSVVQSASGSIVKDNSVVTLAENGLESGQKNAVIIPFDDAYDAMNVTSMFNTIFGSVFLNRDTITVNFTFTRPLQQSEFGAAPFNPFSIINRTRGREVHLAGYLPTDKIDTKYFHTGIDNTTPSVGIYYKTLTNLPWGLAFNSDFLWPRESDAINIGYTTFIPWASSNGTTNMNWYSDTSNMNNQFIYRR